MTAHENAIAHAFAPQNDKDAAQRLADTVSLHLVAASDMFEIVGKWCVFRLDDGRSDGALYDSKDDALRHTKHSKDHCYLRMTPDGITARDAWHFLRANRHPMIDTTAPEHVINAQTMPHMSNMTRAQRRIVNHKIERKRDA